MKKVLTVLLAAAFTLLVSFLLSSCTKGGFSGSSLSGTKWVGGLSGASMVLSFQNSSSWHMDFDERGDRHEMSGSYSYDPPKITLIVLEADGESVGGSFVGTIDGGSLTLTMNKYTVNFVRQ